MRFVHDGSEIAPTFSLQADDGAGGVSNVLAGSVSFTNVNDAPELKLAALTVSEGGTVVLDASNIGVTDPDSTSFTFTASNVGHGTFQTTTNGTNWVVATTFTTADLNAGRVRFVHNGDEDAPTFSLQADDGAGGVSNVLAGSISFTNVNDAPEVIAASGDSAGSNLTETDSKLTALGTLTVTDPDHTDPVTVSVTGVTHTGPTGGLSDATLLSYFTVPGTAVLTASQSSAHFTWNFDSHSEAFNFLAAGETLSLHYTIRPDDSHPPTGTGDGVVTINIAGTNDAPVITIIPAQPANVSEDGTLTSTVTVSKSDPDAGDVTRYDMTGWTPTALANDPVFGGHFYRFVASTSISWTSARAQAIAMGGHLANITSAAENSFIQNSVKPNVAAWIGASDAAQEGTWTWADGPEAGQTFWLGDGNGTPVTYANWWGTEPNGGVSENYGFIDQNGVWTDVPVTNFAVQGFIVEFDNFASFTSYSLGNAYGNAVFNTTTGQLTFNLDNSSAAVQGLGAGDHRAVDVNIVVKDQSGTATTATATFGIDGANDAPVLAGDLSIFAVKGGSVLLTTQDLIAVDPDTPANALTFAVVATSHGYLAKNGVQLAAQGTFTQADLVNGLISFVASDPFYVGAGGFSVSVSDGIAGSTPLITVGATISDAQLTVLTPAGYDFYQDDPASKMGSGNPGPVSSTTFTITNVDANRDFIFTGSGFVYTAGTFTAGSITNILERQHDTQTALASFDLNESAAAWYNAVRARAQGDDGPIKALTGSWTYNLIGDGGADRFPSGSNNDIFTGNGGSDTFDGDFGYDRAAYGHATGPIHVHLAGDTAHGGGYVTGDASVGTDILHSIELVTGGNFADTYDATGFSATSINAGSTVTANTGGLFNEFEGRGGDDTITGNGTTRISYFHATAGVTVTFADNWTGIGSGTSGTAHGTAPGDLAAVGTDTFTGVYSVRGSQFSDTWTGSNNPSGSSEDFEGFGGGDIIHGGGGFDRVVYSREDSGRIFQLGDGTVKLLDHTDTGDELRSIEGVWGTGFNDVYDASTFTASNALNPSINSGDTQFSATNSTPSNFNEFEGDAGDDTITGNNTTRVAFYHATGGVVVALNGTVPGHQGDAFGNDSVGHDTIVSGVSRVRGSEFNDVITGSGGNNTLEGRGGNDVLDGQAGADVLTGGSGSDIFIYQTSGGNDRITDFTRLEGDRIDLRPAGINGIGNLTFTAGTYDSNTNIFTAGTGPDTRLGGFGAGNTIIVQGMASTSFVARDFIFNSQVVVTVQTPDGYDFGTLYDDLAAANRHQAANDSTHIFAVSGSKTFELTGSFTYAGGDPVNGAVTGGTITGITILDTANPMETTQDHVLVNSDGWNINAPTFFSAIQTYGSNHTTAGLDSIFNVQSYSIVGSSGLTAADDLPHAGGDVIFGGNGADTFNGLSGNDTVDYSHATAAVTADLSIPANNTGAAAGDVYISIENLRGSSLADTLTGDGNNNVLEGGPGNDRLDGGGGNNTASYEHATPGAANLGVTVNLTIQSGTVSQNTVQAGSDTLLNIQNIRGSAGNDTLIGNGNDNVLEGGPGGDSLNGGGGTDTASYEHAAGVTTGSGQAAIHIGITASLAHTASNTGDAAGDTYASIENLTGSQFSDILTGDTGANTLLGLGGNDVFVFTPGSSHDVIGDFSPGHDKIELDDFLTPDPSGNPDWFADWVANGGITQQGNDALIHLDAAADTILLKNVVVTSLHANDFLIHPGFTI